jgi:hypothetical protein
MKKLSLTLSCFALLLILNSCGSGSYTVSPKGDTVDIELKSGTKFTGEMIFISDTAVVFASIANDPRQTSRLFYSLNSDINSISIQGYDGSGWATPVIIFQGVPTILFAAAALSHMNLEGGALLLSAVLAIPTIITAILFSATEGDTPQWNRWSNTGNLESLKIYSRYPEGLNEKDLQILLDMCKQKSLKKLS